MKFLSNRFCNSAKKPAFSLLEMLVAIGISAIIITSATTMVGTIYFGQKRVKFSQDFYAEARTLMERMVQISRNNTIDYDRYFIEEGPSCSTFSTAQIPAGGRTTNNKNNRINNGGYSAIFYWDTNGDGTQDRNLGGMNIGGTIDSCAEAWSGTVSNLFLINARRNMRTAIKATGNQVKVQIQLGADTDGDAKADLWGPTEDGSVTVQWGTTCQLISGGISHSILGDSTDEDLCYQAHKFKEISPEVMKITNLTFDPGPNRDPFLNFRVSGAQVHPHVFINLSTELKNPSQHGFNNQNAPQISLQSSASSRVFGNTR